MYDDDTVAIGQDFPSANYKNGQQRPIKNVINYCLLPSL